MNYRVFCTPLMLFVVSCSWFSGDDDDNSSSQSTTTAPQPPQDVEDPSPSSPTGETPDTTRVVASRLVTPEQLSQNIWTSLEFRYGYTDPQGNFVDMITNQLAVLLGGVDFENRDIRDDLPKINTLLIARRLSWDVASAVVWREAQDGAEVLLFKHCSIREDRPYIASMDANRQSEAEASEVRWKEQLTEFYWRLFSRPPSEEEVSAIRETFVQIVMDSYWPPTGWTVVLYSLLSTTEYWYM